MLADISNEIISCQKCELSRTRINAVPGYGNPDATIMLIGEGPGWNEDKQGEPFVGASGKFLDELLSKANLRREDVFITNVVKCRPPSNRDPLPDEIAACGDYLERQIEEIDPAVIVTLGRFSMSRWFPGEKISKIHGTATHVGNRVVVPMYHPAAALHRGNLRPVLEEDFASLVNIVARTQDSLARDGDTKASSPPPEQMELF